MSARGPLATRVAHRSEKGLVAAVEAVAGAAVAAAAELAAELAAGAAGTVAGPPMKDRPSPPAAEAATGGGDAFMRARRCTAAAKWAAIEAVSTADTAMVDASVEVLVSVPVSPELRVCRRGGFVSACSGWVNRPRFILVTEVDE